MHQYTVYERDESGIITRHGDRLIELSEKDLNLGYPFSETLKGWPETTVFWRFETGESVGVAV